MVLMDLGMPDQRGIEFIGHLRRDYPDIRIVAMSDALDSGELRAAELLGAHATIRKPVDSEDLVRIVRELLA